MRILDTATVLATHPRSFDRGQQIEDPAHIEELERHKRSAREHRATDRLHDESDSGDEEQSRDDDNEQDNSD